MKFSENIVTLKNHLNCWVPINLVIILISYRIITRRSDLCLMTFSDKCILIHVNIVFEIFMN